MTHEELKKFAQKTLHKAHNKMFKKNSGYSGDVDALLNFTISATTRQVSLPEAMSGMMVKHDTEIYNKLAKARRASKLNLFTMEEWDENITDYIVYLIFLRAAIAQGLGKVKEIIDGQDGQQEQDPPHDCGGDSCVHDRRDRGERDKIDMEPGSIIHSGREAIPGKAKFEKDKPARFFNPET